MSRPMADTPKRRPRRQFTEEFKASAVRLVLDEGKTVGAAARDLDLTETALREWVRARPGRPDARPHRADDRRARGARPAAQRESRAADGARHPKKSRGLLREAPGVRFAWIAAEKAEFTVAECCRALRVSPSGFYAWQQRPESAHARARSPAARADPRLARGEPSGATGSPRVLEGSASRQASAISREARRRG